MKAKVILLLIFLTVSNSWLSGNTALAQSMDNQNSNLTIEIYVQYDKDKDKRPASKTKFYLLDAEIETILSKAGLKEVQPWDLVGTYAMANTRAESSEYKELYKQKYKDFHIAAEMALKPHIIQTVVTDTEGKARFKAFTPGKYYLFGIAKINMGFSII
ncbi:MAG TPA: hypothetical protein VK892_22605, partial [Pyrinomonadaceae bacterium]|nr:hypothetical protein [Pyrinomonadaceae bacterium]